MGTSGTGVFSTDIAADVRGELRDLIGEGLTREEATRRQLDTFEPDDPDDDVHFWLALAATQWQLGRLLASVRDRAIAIIDDGADLARWEEEASAADFRKRRAALSALRERLLSPLPQPKRVPRRFVEATPYLPGDVLAYRLGSGRVALLRVTQIHEDRGGRSPIIEILRWEGSELPSASEIERLPTWVPARGLLQLPFGKRVIAGHACTRNVIFQASARDDPSPRLALLARGVPIPDLPPGDNAADPNGGIGIRWWRDFDGYLAVVFELT